MSRSLPALRRTVVAVSVAAGAVLALVGLLLQPAFPDDPAAFADLVASSPGALVGVQLYVWSQLFWAIGLVGTSHLVARRAPVLGLLGALLSGLGAFGHAVYGGVLLLEVALATQPDAVVAVTEASQSGAFVPFLACGLFGTVLGMVVLAIGLLRARAAQIWVPIALLVWVVVEFVLPNFVEWSSYLSVVLGIIVFAGLAVAVLRSDRSVWTTADEASVPVAAGQLTA